MAQIPLQLGLPDCLNFQPDLWQVKSIAGAFWAACFLKWLLLLWRFQQLSASVGFSGSRLWLLSVTFQWLLRLALRLSVVFCAFQWLSLAFVAFSGFRRLSVAFIVSWLLAFQQLFSSFSIAFQRLFRGFSSLLGGFLALLDSGLLWLFDFCDFCGLSLSWLLWLLRFGGFVSSVVSFCGLKLQNFYGFCGVQLQTLQIRRKQDIFKSKMLQIRSKTCWLQNVANRRG